MEDHQQILAQDYAEPMQLAKATPQLNVADGFVNQTPSAVLTRRHIIAQWTLVGSGATLNIWQLLTNIATTNDYLRPFGGLAADVEVQVLQSNNSAAYGLTQVSWGYGKSTTNAVQASSAETYFLDVASSEGVSFVVPYRHPQEYVPRADWQREELGWIRLENLDAFSSNGGDAQSRLTILANFKNPRVALLGGGNPLMRHEAMVNHNHMVGQRVVQGATVAAGIVAFQQARDFFTNMVQGIRTTRETVQEVGETASEFAETAANTWETVKSSFPSFSSEGGQHAPVKQSVYGNLSGTTEATTQNYIDVETPNFLREMHNYTPCTDLESLVSLPTYIGKVTPTSATIQSTIYKIPLRYDLQNPTEVGNGFTWMAYYSRFFRFMAADCYMILHFKLTPLSTARVRVSTHYTDATIVPQDGSVPNEVHLIAGSIDIPIYIPYLNPNPVIDSSTVYATVAIEVLEPPSKIAAQDVSMPIYITMSHHNSRFYSLQSFAETSSPLLRSANENTKPQLRHESLYELTPQLMQELLMVDENQDLSQSTFIERIIEQEVQPKEEEVVKKEDEVPKLRHESSLREMHRKPKKQEYHKLFSVPDHMHRITSLETILRRYSSSNDPLTSPPPGSTMILYPNSKFEFYYAFAFEKAALPFAFYSGSSEYKIQVKPGTTSYIGLSLTNSSSNNIRNAADGAVLTNPSLWNVFDYTIPFIAPVPSFYMNANSFSSFGTSYSADFYTDTPETIDYFLNKRAGPDFQLSYPNMLPDAAFWAA